MTIEVVDDLIRLRKPVSEEEIRQIRHFWKIHSPSFGKKKTKPRFTIMTSMLIFLVMMTFQKIGRNVFTYEHVSVVLFAYVFVDFASGLIHICLDNGRIRYDFSYIDSLRIGFQFHHMFPNHNWLVDKDFDAAYEALTVLPACIIALIINYNTFLSSAILWVCIFAPITQMSHYWCHAIVWNEHVPEMVKVFQKYRILMRPECHQIHHQGLYDKNFAIFHGHTNCLLNFFFGRYKKT
jgi:putative component of membrane protein insertase Oxa1/YidC/SpoIIIJ protein YidD